MERLVSINLYDGLLATSKVKKAGYWLSSFSTCLWIEMESRSINTQKTRPISSHLERTNLLNKSLIKAQSLIIRRDIIGNRYLK